MRQYRGKRVDNGEWVEGCYAVIEKRHFILTKEATLATEYFQSNTPTGWPKLTGSHEVIPSTVGQDTGLKAEYSKEARLWQDDRVEWYPAEYCFFEGDGYDLEETEVGVIKWCESAGRWGIETKGTIHWPDSADFFPCTRLGTIHNESESE